MTDKEMALLGSRVQWTISTKDKSKQRSVILTTRSGYSDTWKMIRQFVLDNYQKEEINLTSNTTSSYPDKLAMFKTADVEITIPTDLEDNVEQVLNLVRSYYHNCLNYNNWITD